ncbi:MAG: protelomerase family protein [Leptolyngbyaceae cyanobacterium bins.302]|nr:protelomerase family protein [Leptolyngbyaceae cyanobacterium bins.302]
MGKRTWLENLIDNEYLPAISRLENTPGGRKDAEKWADWMKQQWEQHGLKTLKQQQSLMDRTRRVIKDQLGDDHFALEFMRFTTEEYVQINNEKQGVVSQRNEQVQFLDNPDAIVAQAVRLLNSPEWSEVAAGLSVLTGRRSSEILSTAQFVPKTKWSITFTGALKRRGETQILSFEIPTLTTAEKVCKALEKVRRELPEALGLSPQAVNSKFGQAVARACDHHFADLVPVREGKDNLYTHLFRSIYASIATFWYCPPRVNETEFKAHIQGHFAVLDENNPELRRSLAASRHYSDYEIADQVIANYGGKRKGIKLGVGGVEMIEAFKVDEVVELLEELPPKPRRRQTTSVRLWQDDKTGLNQVFQHLEFNEDLSQQDKMSHLLKWIRERLEMPSPKKAEALQEEDQQEPAKMDNALLVEEVEEPESALPIAKHEETQIKSDPEVQETVVSTGLEAKIDKLVDVMTQFIQVQMQSSPVPQSVPPKPVASRIVQTQEQEAKDTTSQEQPERRRRRSNETDEIIHQAIYAIMQYNDQASRHDEKWAITINALKAFAKSQRKIEMILQDRKEEIKQHHDKHQIDPERHNLKHRGKHKIEEIIRV